MKSTILFITVLLFSISSAYSGVLIRNGLLHKFSGSDGSRMYGEVILVNTSSTEERISFHLNEAMFSCEQQRYFTSDTTHTRSSLAWFEGNLVDRVLAPKEKFIYKFSINIPQDQTLQGSYWSMLMVQVEKPFAQSQVGNALALSNQVRYAIALLTDVNPSKENIQIDFTDVKVETLGNNQKQIAINIQNEDKYIEEVKLLLEVYDAEGNNVLKKETVTGFLFPSFCKHFTIDISELPKGNYECLLVAESREEYIGTNINLSID